MTRTLWSSGNNTLFTELLLGFFLILIILGVYYRASYYGKIPGYIKASRKWREQIYIVEEGLGATLLTWE